MAGDWMPMRLDLWEDPAVIEMATAMGEREEVIVGYCHKIWSWASRQSRDGSVTGVTVLSLGRVTNLPGFPELMRDVGWLVETKDGIIFPKWDNWMSEPAKKRIQSSNRKQKQRENEVNEDVTLESRSVCDKSVTRGEESKGDKRREDKSKEEKIREKGNKKEKTGTDDILDLGHLEPELQQVVTGWLAYKAERRESYRPQGLKAFITQINKAVDRHGSPAVVDAFESAMANGWKGWTAGLDTGTNRKPKTFAQQSLENTKKALREFAADD